MLLSTSKEVPVGKFIVAKVLNNGKTLGPEDIKEIYHGGSTKADELFGWGIARHVADKNGTSLLIFNPKQQIALPEVEEIDE